MFRDLFDELLTSAGGAEALGTVLRYLPFVTRDDEGAIVHDVLAELSEPAREEAMSFCDHLIQQRAGRCGAGLRYPRGMPLRLAIALVLLAGCGDAPLTAYEPPAEPWVGSDRTLLRDDTGRVVVLRGVNARVNGVFDVTFDDGRTPLEDIPDFGPEDVRRMRELGLGLLRFPIDWSGIEPTEGSYDEAYLDRVQAVVSMCADAGVHVIIDFHQDGYSKEIGEDGAPLWAIHPPPDMLLEGPLGGSLSMRIASPQVLRAYTSFFVNDDADTEDQHLQGAFAAMAKHVAERFADEAWVLGYDLYNEPGAADSYLLPFHQTVAAAIREVDTRHLLLFEPSGVRNLLERAPLSRMPFPDDGGVYAVHLYTFAFNGTTADFENLTPADLEPNVTRGANEAASWNVPMLVGEWGVGPDQPNMDLYARTMYELFDDHLASATVWLWKEESQGSWGFFDLNPDGSWTERERVVAAHARVYAERIAGEPTSMRYDMDTQRFELAYQGRTDAAPHVIYLPPSYPSGFVTRCDGSIVDPPPVRDAATGRIEVVCGGARMHMLSVEPE